MTDLRGIDISNNDGHIDWSQAAPHVDLFIAKVTEGTGFVDRFFTEFVRQGAAAGVPYRGGYHFARPSRNSATDEAKYYANAVKAAGVLDLLKMPTHADGTPVPRHWCDQEDPDVGENTPLGRWTYAWCEEVQQILQEPAGVYLSPGWWESHNDDAPAELGKLDEWAATYGSHPANVYPWKKWTIWQYTDKGRIPGISTPVDLDTETLEDFMATLTDQEKNDLMTAVKVILTEVRRTPGSVTLYGAVTNQQTTPNGTRAFKDNDEINQKLDEILANQAKPAS